MNELCLNKSYFEKEYWWSFASVIGILLDNSLVEHEVRIFTGTTLYNYLDDRTTIPQDYPSLVNESKFIQPVVDIFNLIEKRFIHHYVFSTKVNNQDEVVKEVQKWLYKLFNVIEYTYKKYSKIIELYTSNYNDLMKQLESTTESGSRFNDTPQSEEVNLSFEENQFTTNLTKAKQVTHTDSNTPIAKIEEIWQNYRKVILEWLNEFESLFVEENNL